MQFWCYKKITQTREKEWDTGWKNKSTGKTDVGGKKRLHEKRVLKNTEFL